MGETPTFNLSQEQEGVRKIAREFGEKEIAPVTKALDREPPSFPTELYGKMAKAGFIGYTASSEFGGAEKSWIEYATLIEELAYFDASIAFILSIGNLAMAPIELFGSDEQKKKYLPRMIKGNCIGAFALTEPGAGSDASNLKTKAVQEGNHYVVNGEKVFISSGDVADVIILIGKAFEGDEDKGLSAFIIDTEGLSCLSRGVLKDKMGLRGSTTAELKFKDCRIPVENLIGKAGQGFKVAMKSLDYSRVAIAAQAVGLAQACLSRAVDFAKKREAFGGPIAKLAPIQEMVADVSTRIEAARLLTYKAAILMDENKSFTAESAQAKLYAAEVANFAADRAVQIHGGYGYVGDFSDIERLYRDARVIPIYEGTSEIQKMVIARNVLR
jgi:alkylation response protein AidB-like acyl-CoA dehydrogenase